MNEEMSAEALALIVIKLVNILEDREPEQRVRLIQAVFILLEGRVVDV